MWKAVLSLITFGLVTAHASLDPVPLYDFANGCPGLIDIGLPPFVCKQDSYEGDIFIISSLTHQVLKLTEHHGHYDCSVYGYLPISVNGSNGVNLGGSFSLGMTISSCGTIYVSNTGTGPASSDFGSVWTIPPKDCDSDDTPIEAQKLYTATSPFGLPSGLSLDERRNVLYLSSETDGTVYKVLTDTGVGSVWASASNPTYALLAGTSGIPGFGGTIDNTNLFGAPFGPVASDLDERGKKLFVGSADRGLVLEITVNKDGSAGAIRTVGSSPNHTVEGVFFDNKNERVIFGSVFRNGTNLTPDGPGNQYNGGVLAGNSLWRAYLDESPDHSKRFYDERLGAVCSVNTAEGVLRHGSKKLLVVSSGFDSLPAWPLGLVRLGTQPYPTNGVNGSTTGPALPNAYNAKIWVLNT